MQLTRLKGGGGGMGRLWYRYVVARAVARLLDIVGLGDVKFCNGSMTVRNSGQMYNTTKWLFPLCHIPHREGACSGILYRCVGAGRLGDIHVEGGSPFKRIWSKSG